MVKEALLHVMKRSMKTTVVDWAVYVAVRVAICTLCERRFDFRAVVFVEGFFLRDRDVLICFHNESAF